MLKEIIGIGLLVLFTGIVWIVASEINTDALSPSDFCKDINGISKFENNTSFSLIPDGRWYCLIEQENLVERKEVIYINYNWKIIEGDVKK